MTVTSTSAPTDEPERRYRERIGRAVAAIVADPLAEHTLESLAALAHFSPFHFHRIYSGVIGETVAATVRRLRLARAAQALAVGRDSVTQVALASGYTSPQAFSRAFRDFAGLTPRAFQRQRGLGGLGAAAPLGERSSEAPEALAVDVIERGPQRVHALVHRGPASTIPHTWWRLMRIAARWPVRARVGIGSGDGSDAGTSPDGGFRYHAAVALDGDPPATRLPLKAIDLPGGRYSRHALIGPYTQIDVAISALYASWLPHSGYEPDDRPLLQLYHSPHDTPAHQLRTDLLLPIRPLE